MKKLKGKQFTKFKDQKQIYQLHFSYLLCVFNCSRLKLLCLNFLYGYMDKNNAIKHDSSNATLY